MAQAFGRLRDLGSRVQESVSETSRDIAKVLEENRAARYAGIGAIVLAVAAAGVGAYFLIRRYTEGKEERLPFEGGSELSQSGAA